MPTIIIEGPPVKDLERKRRLAKEVTEAVAKFYGYPMEKIHGLIKENPPENVIVAGELLIDRRQRAAGKST